MPTSLAVAATPSAWLRDWVDLGKPRLSALVLFTSAIGVWWAPVQPHPAYTLVFVAVVLAIELVALQPLERRANRWRR